MEPLVFDDPSTWESSLIEALGSHFSARLSALKEYHEYVEDSLDTLLAHDRQAILKLTLAWIASNSVAAYHGTRLSSSELQSIREEGLKILDPASRVVRLRRALSAHPEWRSVAAQLEETIDYGGSGLAIGSRRGQAHLTLSRIGLTDGFNHYLTHGSEFDQHVAHNLLGDDGVSLLRQDGVGYVLEFSVPGPAAITAAHRYFPAEEMIGRGEVPNIVREFLKSLSYRVYDPNFGPTSMKADCGLVFFSDLPSEWLRSAETWQDSAP